ncbi:MAG: DnaD domain protein, partial [Clostridia bacterium]|nr:DnaD domain protein [Clostridia bacterium]
QGAGILGSEEESGTEAKESEQTLGAAIQPSIVRSRSDLPTYTAEEVAAILSQREDISQVIQECQNVYQKVFTRHDINVILALMDYLGLDGEYVLSLAAFCSMSGDRTLRKLQAMAVQFTDEGIQAPQQLHEKLRRIELANSMEGEIRKLFGIGTRSFTKREIEMIARWEADYHFGKDMIRKAYELCVDSCGSASLAYTDAILKRWSEEGIRTPEAVDAEIESKRKNPSPPQPESAAGRRKKPAGQKLQGESSFNIDDFLDYALLRSAEKMEEGNG